MLVIKNTISLILLVLMCMVVLTCSNDNEELVTLTFSIEYVPTFSDTKKCEVIILTGNEKKVLERTVIPANTKHSFSVQSPTDKITLVVIDSNSWHWAGLPPTFSIRAFRNVTPGNWKIPATGIPFKEPLTGAGPSTGNDAIFNYINMPDYDDSEQINKPLFATSNGGSAWNVLHENHSSFATYVCTQPMPIDYTYLLIPSLGKYKLTDPASTKAQIDLAEMKDAKKIVFDGLEKITSKGLFDLVVYTEEGKWIQLGVSYPGWDLIFPEEDLIKKYELSFFGWGGGDNKAYFEYYGLLDQVPSSIDMIDDSYYTLERNGSDISIDFLKEAPTYYYLNYSGSNIDFILYSPTNVTSAKPVEFLKSLNSSFLQGRNIHEMDPISFGLTKVNPMDYQTYWNYVLTPGKLKAKSIKEITTYVFDFRP